MGEVFEYKTEAWQGYFDDTTFIVVLVVSLPQNCHQRNVIREQIRMQNLQNRGVCLITTSFIRNNYHIHCKYRRGKKYRHPYLINTIEMRSLWMEIKYIKSTARLLDRDWVNKGGLDLSKEVLWVSVGQRAADLRAVKVGGQQIILPISLVRTRFARAGLIGRIFCWPLTLTAHRFAALWPTETHSTSLERSKPPLLTQSLFKSLAVLLMYFISIHSDLISIEFIK